MMYRAFNEDGNMIFKGEDLEKVKYVSNVDEFGGCIVDELGAFVYGFEWVSQIKAVKRFRKALKHLGYSRDSLNYWRERYVEIKRDTRSAMDIRWYQSLEGKTIRECELEDAIREMNEAKERIAKFERIVMGA